MKKFLALIMALSMLLLAGCGGSQTADTTAAPAASNSAEDIYNALLSFEGMAEMSKMNENMMLNVCGIQAEDCLSAHVGVCSSGLEAHEIWVIEAKDAAALEHLEELALKRLVQKGEETKTYSPEQYKMVEQGRVVTKDNFLGLIVAPNAEVMAAAFEAAVQ